MIKISNYSAIIEPKVIKNGRLLQARVAKAALHDFEISSRLEEHQIEIFAKQIAKAYDKENILKNLRNIRNIEKDHQKARDFSEICERSDIKAEAILDDKAYKEKNNKKLIKIMSAGVCLNKDSFVGLAKSIAKSRENNALDILISINKKKDAIIRRINKTNKEIIKHLGSKIITTEKLVENLSKTGSK